MIEKMKKLTLLIYHASKDKFLKNLQDLGIVHLEINKNIQNGNILSLNDRIIRITKIENLLINIKKEYKKKVKKKEYQGNLEELLNEVDRENDRLNSLQAELDNLKKDIASVFPWGNFDPENIKKMENIGLNIKFFVCSLSKFKKIDKKNLAYEVINNIKGMVYFVVIKKKDDDDIELDANEQKFTLKELNKMYDEKTKIINEIKKQKDILIKLSAYIGIIKKEKSNYLDRLDYDIANSNLKEEVEGKILILTGWVPARITKKKVEPFLQKEDAAYFLTEPAKEDIVPILLKNNPVSRLFEPIMKIFSLPGYVEIDTTVFLAPFFALFFGLCQADVGYGLILLTVTLLASIFLIGNKTGRRFAFLGVILSIMVIAGGIMLNGFLGFSFTEMLIDKYKILPEYFKNFAILGTQNDAMFFALFLGIFQVLVGFTIKTFIQIRNNGFQGGLQPIGNFFLLFGAAMYAVTNVLGESFKIGPIAIGKFFFLFPFPKISGIALAGLGTLLILFFNNIDKKIYIRPLLGLWEMYGNITGIPGDILSYLRLFALGLSGGLLGGAVNQIAFMAKGEGSSIIGIFLMVLIMIVGHGINLCLSLIGSFVHPLRLTFVEFYKNIGFTGGGTEYSPFSNKNIIKK